MTNEDVQIVSQLESQYILTSQTLCAPNAQYKQSARTLNKINDLCFIFSFLLDLCVSFLDVIFTGCVDSYALFVIVLFFGWTIPKLNLQSTCATFFTMPNTYEHHRSLSIHCKLPKFERVLIDMTNWIEHYVHCTNKFIAELNKHWQFVCF